MELTETQKHLVNMLRFILTRQEDIIGVMLTLKTEKQQEAMIDYIIENRNNLDKEKIMKKMLDLVKN